MRIGLNVGLLCAILFFWGVTAFNSTCVVDELHLPSEVQYPYTLGDNQINITVYTQPSRGGNQYYSFINLHENENTSVVAAKTLIYQKGGGSIVFLQHGGTRDIYFTYKGVNYTIDPNRMFTWEGYFQFKFFFISISN